MDGNHGQVTIRLPYPVRIDSFTIDHVSSLIVNPTNGHETAPKTIRVTGYPPCDDNDDMMIMTMTMVLARPWDSKFRIQWKSPKFITTRKDQVVSKRLIVFGRLKRPSFPKLLLRSRIVAVMMMRDDDDDDDEDSCSQAASCTAPPRMNVAGITVKILENWGNPEYTCMYRFRVHGEPAH